MMRRWTISKLLICALLSLIMLLVFGALGHAQVPVALSPDAKLQFFDATGKPLAGGALFTFAAGTTTPQATYTESTGTTPYSNPIILDSGGFVVGPLFITSQSYKYVLCAAFTGVSGSGTCATFGPQQWVIDNILLPPFLAGNNTFTGNNIFNGTSVFNAAVTLNAGGTFAGTISGSPTFSGTPIFTGGMTVTGGTFTGSTLASPIVSTTTIVPNLNPDRQSIIVPNNAVATVLNELVKLTGSPSTATVTLAGDTAGAIGICTANCTNSGSATVQVNGLVNCVFSAGTTAGDFVVFSATAGNCLDVGGGGYPSSGQVLGRVLSTNGGAGTYQIDMFPADIRALTVSAVFPNIAYNTASVSTNANIPTTTMFVPGTSSDYYFIWYLSETVLGAGCAGTTTLDISITWTDPLAAGATTQTILGVNIAVAGNGTIGAANGSGGTFSTPPGMIRAKIGTNIQYSTTYHIGGGCAPGPQYQIFPILEQLTSN